MARNEQRYSIIASPSCSWCKQALILLVENFKDCEMFVHDINSPELWEEVRSYNWNSIPCIWQGGKFIGGFAELQKHLEDAKIEKEKVPEENEEEESPTA